MIENARSRLRICYEAIASKQQGFTLIELMITVALAAIVLTMGVPSFQETIRNNQLATRANEFVGALNLARSEAVKRGVRVTLCKSADGMNCTAAGGYEQGWIVFADADNDATVDDPSDVIKVFQSMPASMTLAVSGSPTNDIDKYISFVAQGMNRSISGSFQAGMLVLCKDTKARRIILNSVGRVRVETNASC